jgi:hypothetical protein
MNAHCKKYGHTRVEFDVPLDAYSYLPKGRCLWCGSPAQYVNLPNNASTPTAGTSRQSKRSKSKASSAKSAGSPSGG